MDQMVRRYTSQRRSSRWSTAMFFLMLCIFSLTSYIIYYGNNNMTDRKTTARCQFLRRLSQKLTLRVIQQRTANPQVMHHFTTNIPIESAAVPCRVPWYPIANGARAEV